MADTAQSTPLAETADGRPPKASTVLARDIAVKIVRRELLDDEPLPAEGELVASYGVSRAVVRESMRLLEHDGLIAIRRGASGGARVRAPQAATSAVYVGLLLQILHTSLDDLDVGLSLLEREAVLLTATRRPAEGIAMLREALAGEADPSVTGSALDAFHFTLGPATGNRVVTALFEVVTGVRARHSRAAVAQSRRPEAVERDFAKAHAFHGKIVDLIEAGEADTAAQRWQRHSRVAARALAQDPSRTVLDLFQSALAAMDWGSELDNGNRPKRLPKGADLVAGEFRRRIAAGTLHEGESLPTEAEIMEEFGLSRPPVREAVRVLEADGLIVPVRGSHRGSRVRRPRVAVAARHLGVLVEYRQATVAELLEAQFVLGRSAAGMVAPARLGARLVDMDRLLELGSSPSWRSQVDAAINLHDALVSSADNQTLSCLNGLTDELLRRHVAAVDVDARRRRRARESYDQLRSAQETARQLTVSGTTGEARAAWEAVEVAQQDWLSTLLRPDQPVRTFT